MLTNTLALLYLYSVLCIHSNRVWQMMEVKRHKLKCNLPLSPIKLGKPLTIFKIYIPILCKYYCTLKFMEISNLAMVLFHFLVSHNSWLRYRVFVQSEILYCDVFFFLKKLFNL
uniref:U112-Liphistoxin-Lth1a_1 n=1 Tax=Liphistius thaleban TaxID=1905330 RepID=A0A4Q8K0W9_9ARAC